jgi:hypothetical protein
VCARGRTHPERERWYTHPHCLVFPVLRVFMSQRERERARARANVFACMHVYMHVCVCVCVCVCE